VLIVDMSVDRVFGLVVGPGAPFALLFSGKAGLLRSSGFLRVN
jgi:hypothetical protein